VTRLTGITPTPDQLGEAWRDEFRDAILDAGGADGRLSEASARRILQRDDAGRLAADNALAFFDRTGQKTVSAQKLLRVLGLEVTQAAEAIAGSNQRVSLREGRNLPEHIRPDFFHLRGKGLPDSRTYADFVADAVSAVRASIADDWSATRLSGVPRAAFGQRPIDQYWDADNRANIYVYAAQGELYFSVGASANSPARDRVGWYHAGSAPRPPEIQ
jgi:hypothetical protein